MALCLCLSVCMSVTSRRSKTPFKTGELINLVFGTDASFDQSYAAF